MNLEIKSKISLWYLSNKRILPWRTTKDPYKVWISEIILQQTRINQGLPYYLSFIKAFPTLPDLANSSLDAVLKIWQGLGYYSRARNLHLTAQHLALSNDGRLPGKYKELIKLKGIGPYTAAAIASIAYNEPIALLDGNVYRVLSRLFGINYPIESKKGLKHFQQQADELLDPLHPGDHNQAMMELGAMICLPQQPHCNKCPVCEHCYALEHDIIDKLPVKAKKEKPSKRYFYYLVIMDGKNNFIIRRRTQKDIWQDLYDFPLIEKSKNYSITSVIKSSQWKEIFFSTPLTIENTSKVIIHKLTHQEIVARFIKIKIINLANMQGAG